MFFVVYMVTHVFCAKTADLPQSSCDSAAVQGRRCVHVSKEHRCNGMCSPSLVPSRLFELTFRVLVLFVFASQLSRRDLHRVQHARERTRVYSWAQRNLDPAAPHDDGFIIDPDAGNGRQGQAQTQQGDWKEKDQD